jgi:hypothetical protein
MKTGTHLIPDQQENYILDLVDYFVPKDLVPQGGVTNSSAKKNTGKGYKKTSRINRRMCRLRWKLKKANERIRQLEERDNGSSI